MWEAPWKSFAILFLSLAVREKKEDYALFYWSQRQRPHKKEGVLRSITLPLHGKNKWLSNNSIQKKTGPNNGTKVVSKEAIRMQQTGALLWLYAWRNEAGNPTLQLYQQKMEEHEHWCTTNDKPQRCSLPTEVSSHRRIDIWGLPIALSSCQSQVLCPTRKSCKRQTSKTKTKRRNDHSYNKVKRRLKRRRDFGDVSLYRCQSRPSITGLEQVSKPHNLLPR